MAKFRVHYDLKSLAGTTQTSLQLDASSPNEARKAAIQNLRGKHFTITKIKRVKNG